MIADVAWWFGWGLSEIEAMTFEDLQKWIVQASRQIKAGYAKATP